MAKIVSITKKKKQPSNSYGVKTFLISEYPQFCSQLRFNTFNQMIVLRDALIPWSKQIPVNREINENDIIDCKIFCQSYGLSCTTEMVLDAIKSISHKNEYHPIRNLLDRLEWDKVARLNTWLKNYCGAIGDSTYLQAVGARFLISAVARVYEPGCKVDTILILEGEQGIGKSEVFQVLALNNNYFTDSVYNIEGKDIFETIRGKWIIEIPELDAFKNLRATRLKQFASSRVDNYRPPYEKYNKRQPRQCVFAATTNETEYLKDESGGRRFWPVQCSRKLDIKKLKKDVLQLWAEAKERYFDKEQWWLNDEEEQLAKIEQADRIEKDIWTKKIQDFLIARFAEGEEIITIEDILTHEEGFGMSINAISKVERNRVKACIEAMGHFKYVRIRLDGIRTYGFKQKLSY